MSYVLNCDPETKRILSAGIMLKPPADAVLVDELPEGDTYDYLYVNGEYIYDPLPQPSESEPQPTQEERIAQLEEELKAAKILLGLEV